MTWLIVALVLGLMLAESLHHKRLIGEEHQARAAREGWPVE